MGNLTSRTARVVNRCGADAQLLIKQDHSPYPKKKILIPQGGYADVSYADVDYTHNPDRPKGVSVVVGGVEMGYITSAEIRDNMLIKLCLVTTENGKESVTVEPIKGKLSKRLGISWKMRDYFGMKLKQGSSTVVNPENA